MIFYKKVFTVVFYFYPKKYINNVFMEYKNAWNFTHFIGYFNKISNQDIEA